jgi:hypothetical protein
MVIITLRLPRHFAALFPRSDVLNKSIATMNTKPNYQRHCEGGTTEAISIIVSVIAKEVRLKQSQDKNVKTY